MRVVTWLCGVLTSMRSDGIEIVHRTGSQNDIDLASDDLNCFNVIVR